MKLWIDSYRQRPNEPNEYDLRFETFEYSDRLLLDGERRLEGRLCVLSPRFRMDLEVALIVIHSPRIGLGLLLRKLKPVEMPQAPFLLTSAFNTEVIFNGDVLIEPPPELASEGAGQSLQERIPVGGIDWFGILGISPQSRKCNLIAFAETPSVSIRPAELIRQLDVNEEFGRIHLLRQE